MGDNERSKAIKIAKLMAVFFIVVVIILSAVNFSVKTNMVSLTSPNFLRSQTTGTNVAHYNFAWGYLNFSVGNNVISFGYVLRPFSGWNPVYAGPVNYSLGNVPSTLVVLLVYQLSNSGASNIPSVPFVVNNISLASPQGMSGNLELWSSVEPNSFGVILNPLGQFIQQFPASKVLGQYPGYHNFNFNFTLTIYNTLGPYKFPSQSKNVHLEYNNTIID